MAIANADVTIRLVNGGRAARVTGLNVDAYNAAVAAYVVIAYECPGSQSVLVLSACHCTR